MSVGGGGDVAAGEYPATYAASGVQNTRRSITALLLHVLEGCVGTLGTATRRQKTVALFEHTDVPTSQTWYVNEPPPFYPE